MENGDQVDVKLDPTHEVKEEPKVKRELQEMRNKVAAQAPAPQVECKAEHVICKKEQTQGSRCATGAWQELPHPDYPGHTYYWNPTILEARWLLDEEMDEEIVVQQELVDPQDRTIRHATEAARSEVKIESREADTECPFAQYTLKEEEETPKNKKSNSGAMERASGSGGQANEESSLSLKVVGPGEKTVYVDVPFEGSPGLWQSVARTYAAQAVSAKISATPSP